MSAFRVNDQRMTICFIWDKPRRLRRLSRRNSAARSRERRSIIELHQFAQPGGFGVGRAKAARLTHQQRPPGAILWRDLTTFRGNQDIAFKTPAGPGFAGQFKPRQDARQLVDRKRDAVRADLPVMPSAIRDLKVFPGSLDRPAQLEPSVTQPRAKLGAGFRVMRAGFSVVGAVTVLHTMYIMLTIV